MKKNLFSLMALLLTMLFTNLTLTSCSDDDEDNTPQQEESALIGKWANIKSEYHGMDAGEEISGSDEVSVEEAYILEIKADGTWVGTLPGEDEKDSGKWEKKDDILQMTETGDSEVEQAKIVTLDEKTLVLETVDIDDWYQKDTYVRLK